MFERENPYKDHPLKKHSIAELKKQLEEQTKEHLIREMEKLPEYVREITKNSAAAIVGNALGVKIDHWGKVEIPYSREDSPMLKKLGAEALHYLETNKAELLEDAFKILQKEKADLKARVKSVFQQTVLNTYRNKASDAALVLVNEVVQEVMEKVAPDIKKKAYGG